MLLPYLQQNQQLAGAVPPTVIAEPFGGSWFKQQALKRGLKTSEDQTVESLADQPTEAAQAIAKPLPRQARQHDYKQTLAWVAEQMRLAQQAQAVRIESERAEEEELVALLLLMA